MNILKRSLAPITDDAWEEIDSYAKEIFNYQLSARKIVDIIGPKGLDYSALNTGRLDIPEKDNIGLKYGIRKVQPLIETTNSFELNIWELDNISRGEKDPDLTNLEKAVKESSKFEEDVIYNGLDKANVKGFSNLASLKLDFPKEYNEYLECFTSAINLLEDKGINGPYALLINPDVWVNIVKASKGYPLEKHLKGIFGASIIKTKNIEIAYVISLRGGDFELTLGQDLSIGYKSHNSENVKLFIMESFTFRIIEPNAYVKLG